MHPSILPSIIASGLATGAVYTLIAITYNIMYSSSRVMSFTAGFYGMLGGVFGALFIGVLNLPILIGFALTLICCGLVSVIAEIVAVRPFLKTLDQHLYVLSTLAFSLMIEQVV